MDGEEPFDEASHSTLRNGGKGDALQDVHLETRVLHAGTHRPEWTTDPLGRSFINPPVHHASTIAYPTVASLRATNRDVPFSGLSYGGHGTPVHFALEEAFAVVEGATNAVCTSSGTSAFSAALLSFVSAGDHVLVTDAVYKGTRDLCDGLLARLGVSTTYFPPAATAADLAPLFTPATTAVFLECPASLSFEVQDVRAVAAVAHARGAKVLVDNAWGPAIFRPLALGADVSVNAATKYVGGHGDLLLGLVATRTQADYRAVRITAKRLGLAPGPDDAFLALRGLRTMALRMERHGASGLAVARWLEGRPEVRRVMHPGLDSHPQHAVFERQFSGAAGLFGFQLIGGFSRDDVDRMIDGMRFFVIGNSWGGYESLLIPTDINAVRSVTEWKYGDGFGQTLRIHIGLDNVKDLLEDLNNGFDRLRSNMAESIQ